LFSQSFTVTYATVYVSTSPPVDNLGFCFTFDACVQLDVHVFACEWDVVVAFFFS